MKELTLEQLLGGMQSDPGLVIGSGVSTHQLIEDELRDYLREKLSLRSDQPQTLHDLVDQTLLEHPELEHQVRQTASDFLTLDRPENIDINYLKKPTWSAIISIAPDLSFHKAYNLALDSKPLEWKLSTIADRGIVLAQKSVPYYCLLGDPRETARSSHLALSGSDYLDRRRIWTDILSTAVDFLKGEPLIFVGTGRCFGYVVDLFDTLLKLHPRAPSRFVFLEGDPNVKNPKLLNMARRLGEIVVLKSDVAGLCNGLAGGLRGLNSLPLFVRQPGRYDLRAFSKIADIAHIVPLKEQIHANAAERHKNLDILFRPTHLNWQPYALGLEFRRESVQAITQKLTADTGATRLVIEVAGEASSGKTIVLRSAAFDLAQVEGFLCIWLRRGYSDSPTAIVDQLRQSLDSFSRENKDCKLCIFLDDPLGCAIKLDDLIRALRGVRTAWRLVVCRRNSEASEYDISDIVSDTEKLERIEVGAHFTEAEWARLPNYLYSIGAFPDENTAKNELNRISGRDSRDVLCALYYLLPQTKSVIFESVQQEYVRLGGLEQTIRDIAIDLASASTGSKRIAKDAYEMVTVCAGFSRTPVPVEVLVSSLGVTFEQWFECCENSKPIWGLLYDEYHEDAKTYAYRNRNEVVTRVVLGIVNGHEGGHAGEFRTLRRMLGACSSNLPQYLQFIRWILVDRRRIIEERFTGEQIVELYDAALKAFPGQLGIVEHHKAIARSKKENEQLVIYAELQRVLFAAQADQSPNSDSPDNIHTSSAAILVRAIKNGEGSLEENLGKLKQHISSALSSPRVNWHAQHTHAHSLIELHSRLRFSNPAEAQQCLIKASQIVERAAVMLQPVERLDLATIQSRQLFSELRREIYLSVADIPKARVEAWHRFETTKKQDSLVLIARLLAGQAAESERNGDFKKVDDELREWISKIRNNDEVPLPDLIAAKLENEFRWKLIKGSTSGIIWKLVWDELTAVFQLEQYRNDPFWVFYAAVAAFNLKDYPKSEYTFQQLRRRDMSPDIRRLVRCWYLNKEGAVRILEGRISGKADTKVFIFCPELDTDVMSYIDKFPNVVGASVHFKLAFTFEGPLALKPN